jgi:transcriptional regulator NrdR family protein
MVCIYCGNATQVKNSRLQRRANQVWRRRQCAVCKAIFTTQEVIEVGTSLVVQYDSKTLVPFSRDKLFVSVYESCKHRAAAADDAAALTKTIIARLLRAQSNGTIICDAIVRCVRETLERFDPTAAAVYGAYHK